MDAHTLPSAQVPVISYARISADSRGRGEGVADQHRTNREHAERFGYTVAAEMTDNDLSASKLDKNGEPLYRPAFEAMVKAMLTGAMEDGTPVAGVVVRALDRVARRFSDWERFTDALTAEDGRVYVQDGSVKDPYSDGFIWEGAASMVGAKSEPKKIAKRTKDAHLRRARQGAPVGGNRPFGWLPDRLTLCPDEAPWARRMVADFIAGRSLGAIVKDLQEGGVRSTGSKGLWTTTGLRHYLTNPRLCGWRRYGDEIIRDDEGNPVVGKWAAICTPEEWLAMQVRFDARKGKRIGSNGEVMEHLGDWRNLPRKHLLTGLLRCGKVNPLTGLPCNAPLQLRTSGTKTHMYACQGKRLGGCGGIGRDGPKTDAYITEIVLARLEESARAERAVTHDWPRAGEYAALLARRNSFTELWHASKMTDDHYFTELPRLEAGIKSLRADEARFMAAKAQAESAPADIRAEWDRRSDDVQWRRSVIERAIRTVIVLPAGKTGPNSFDPAKLKIVWRED